MNIIKTKSSTKKSKNKKRLPDYSSWDTFTQARYLFDLHQQLGNKISIKRAYLLALSAMDASCDK